jgi:hypothetical protein
MNVLKITASEPYTTNSAANSLHCKIILMRYMQKLCYVTRRRDKDDKNYLWRGKDYIILH